jgi:urease accessory protein
MAMAGQWGMNTDLLTLMQWLSPSFPTGGFAYAHGLETAMVAGLRDAAGIQRWVADVLQFGAGRADGILLAHARRGGADEADMMARAMAASRERLEETLAQGAAFARTVAALTARDLPPRAMPVAVGEATRRLNLPDETVIACYLHAFAANVVACATRFVPLGQTEGQGVLAALHPLIAGIAAECAKAGRDDIGTAALGADLAAMQHETLDVRIFKT